MLTKNEAMLLVDQAEALIQELDDTQDRDAISRQLSEALHGLRDIGSDLLSERLPNLQAWTDSLSEYEIQDDPAEGSVQSKILEQLAEIRTELDLLD